MENFSSKGIRFSGDSIKSCVGFIDLVDSTNNTITMDKLNLLKDYILHLQFHIINYIKIIMGNL